MDLKPKATDLYEEVYTECARINWYADQIKKSQVVIETNVRLIQRGIVVSPPLPPIDPPIDPPIITPPTEPPPVTPPPIEEPGPPISNLLIQKSNMQYIGAFQLPKDPAGAAYDFGYATTGMCFNSQHNSLYINNHIYEQKTAEVSIPHPSMNLAAVPTANYIQTLGDITEGNLNNLCAGGSAWYDKCQIGGLLVYGNKLVGTSYIFYDASKTAVLTHFTSGLNVSQWGDYRGMYKVGDLNAGFYDGYMCHIPAEWQAAFGGPCLTGNAALSIITRTSYGPSAHVFNPSEFDSLGNHESVGATPIVYYDSQHPNLGSWDQQDHVNTMYNMGTRVTGMVFPTGSRTLLFFGTQGMGVPCYGEAPHCYDPALTYKGTHAYPYAYWVWAYDANELLKVKQGAKNPWDVQPYAAWALDLPASMPTCEVQGATYDPLTQRIYVSAMYAACALGNPYDKGPLIHVFQLNATAGGLLTI
jgi:hypothetical protein